MSLSLAEAMAATPAMLAVFDARAGTQAMLETEAALGRAGAAAGLIPAAAADAIAAACKADAIDLDALARDGARAGTVVIPLVAWLKSRLPEHARYVHCGSTSQDIIDTGLVLQLRAGIHLLQADLTTMANATAELAREHAHTPMLGRTLLQAALPTTFGLKAANWLVAVNDSRRAIEHAASQAVFVQCGGAVGTLDALGENAPVFLEAFGLALSLPVAFMPWHTHRAPLARLAAAIAGAVGVAGKIGTDIALMMQSEISEVCEPAAFGRGGSSAMPHKRNPTLSIAARAAAARMPGFVATLLAAMDQEHERAAGAWQAEAATWPALMLTASGGLKAIAEALSGLAVFPARMAANLALAPDLAVRTGNARLVARALDDHENLAARLESP